MLGTQLTFLTFLLFVIFKCAFTSFLSSLIKKKFSKSIESVSLIFHFIILGPAGSKINFLAFSTFLA